MKEKLVILHVIDSLGVGGAEILLRNTLELLPEFDHYVVFLNYPNILENEIKATKANVVCLEHRGWKDFWQARKKLRKIINDVKPTLVHSHLFYSTLLCRVTVPKAVPFITTIHSTLSKDAFQKDKKSLWAERITQRKYHTLIGVSKYVLDDYKKWVPFKGRSFFLYNFLPDSFYTSKRKFCSDSPVHCVAVGTLKEAKNYNYLLEIFENLRDTNIHLDIYGNGSLFDELNKKIIERRLNVKLRGYAKNMTEILPKYDLFIQASEHEGFGLSVIESMASNVPVFLADIPVFREITAGHAHFFPLKNRLKASEYLRGLYKSPELRTKHVIEAFSYCKSTYSAEAYKQKLLYIYEIVSKSNFNN